MKSSKLDLLSIYYIRGSMYVCYMVIESNYSLNRGEPLFSPTDSYPQSLSDLLQNHMSTSQTIRAHAQEV